MARLGDTLKAAREQQGLTIEEAAKLTHIRQHLLEALEENRFETFPSPVIARGLIRNYAKFLKLDPIEALTLYDGKGRVPVKGQRLTPDGIEFMDLSMSSRSYFLNWELLVGVVLGFLVVGAAWYFFYGADVQPAVVAATATPTTRAAGISETSALILDTPTPLPTDTPTPLPPTFTPTPLIYTGVTVELVINQASWVQILVDETKEFEGILQPGDTPSWTGEQRVAIRAGNGGGVEVIVNGVDRGVMGANGQVVDQIWEKVTDPTALTTPPATPSPDETAEATPTEQFSELTGSTATATPNLEPTPVEDAADQDDAEPESNLQ